MNEWMLLLFFDDENGWLVIAFSISLPFTFTLWWLALAFCLCVVGYWLPFCLFLLLPLFRHALSPSCWGKNAGKQILFDGGWKCIFKNELSWHFWIWKSNKTAEWQRKLPSATSSQLSMTFLLCCWCGLCMAFTVQHFRAHLNENWPTLAYLSGKYCVPATRDLLYSKECG